MITTEKIKILHLSGINRWYKGDIINIDNEDCLITKTRTTKKGYMWIWVERRYFTDVLTGEIWKEK